MDHGRSMSAPMVSEVEESEVLFLGRQVLFWQLQTFDEEDQEEEEEQEEQHCPNAALWAGFHVSSATAACRDCGFGFGGSSVHRIVTQCPPPFL